MGFPVTLLVGNERLPMVAMGIGWRRYEGQTSDGLPLEAVIDDRRSVVLSVEVRGVTLVGEGSDVYEALQDLRQDFRVLCDQAWTPLQRLYRAEVA